MARFDKGYVKLYRKIENSWIGDDGIALAIFCLLLLWARRFESQIIFCGKPTTLSPGDVLTSTLEVSKRLKFSRKTVEKRFELLRKTGVIKTKKSRKGTIVTLVNWESYQSIEDKVATEEQQRSQQSDNDVTLNGESKKVRKKERGGEKNSQKRAGATAKPPAPSIFNQLWKTYFETYKSTYGVEKRRNKVVKRQLEEIIHLVGDDAPGVVKTFIENPTRYYVSRAHDLSLCIEDYGKLHTAFKQREART